MYVKAENVDFSYGEKEVLHRVSFGLARGEITGLIGSNGAGKSTMLKIMMGRLKPQRGSVTIGGSDIASLKNEKNPVTFVPDVPVYYEELTVWEHLQFVKALYPKNTVSIEEIVDRFALQEHLYKIPGALSKGTLQKLMVALALLRRYEVFLADEPFTGLDPGQIHELRRIMRELWQQGKAVLISTHLLELAETICDRYLFLHDGKILAEGSKEEVMECWHLQGEWSLEALYLFLTGKER